MKHKYLERFVEQHKDVPLLCWLWPGTKDKNGYGRTKFNGRTRRAHRAVYEFLGHQIPDGKYLCHHCDTPACCNPVHLFVGDALANALDAKRKDRHSRGERNGCSHLKDGDIRIIRALAGTVTQTALAKRFNIRQSSIWLIQNRKQWTHVTD